MSYTVGEGLVLTKLQAIGSGTTWTSTNSARGKWLMLNSGAADHYAVLKMGKGANEFMSFSTSLRTYTTIIEVWQSYKDDGTSYTNMLGYMEGILDQFDAERILDDTTGTVQDSRCTKWDEVEEMWKRGADGPRWLKQNFYIEWKEENSVTFS
jgi:hypothetical protein